MFKVIEENSIYFTHYFIVKDTEYKPSQYKVGSADFPLKYFPRISINHNLQGVLWSINAIC